MLDVKTIENDLEWLRKISREVDITKEDITGDIKNLEEYCISNDVLAMAAIQLGIDKRLMYIKNTDLDSLLDNTRDEKTILVNPVIIKREGLTSYWETCASCLDNMGLVLRPYKVLIKYRDLNGKRHRKTFKGFPATVFSHEYDHLDGILHMDKSLEIMDMKVEDRIEFRKTHKYEIMSETGDFEQLENEYNKK